VAGLIFAPAGSVLNLTVRLKQSFFFYNCLNPKKGNSSHASVGSWLHLDFYICFSFVIAHVFSSILQAWFLNEKFKFFALSYIK